MTPIDKALQTWYEPDHPLHLDPLHPAIGLVGEAGELLDLFKKHRFKNGISWWDCIYCGTDKKNHINSKECHTDYKYYTPKVLDKLGGLWFYLRILAYQNDIELQPDEAYTSSDLLHVLVALNHACARYLDSNTRNIMNTSQLHLVYSYLIEFLAKLDCTLDQLTELNYNKLKDGDNHGWATARKSP